MSRSPLAPPAAAGLLLLAAVALAPGSQAATILCQSDCPVVGTAPVHGPADTPFDFRLGLAAEPAEDLALVVSGSVYVFGDVDVGTGDVVLDAGELVDLEPGTIEGPGIVLGGGVLSAATLGLPAGSPYEVDGDAYLDVSGVTLAGLSVTAGADIVIGGQGPVVFTPEPGSGLLLASALGLLAARRAPRATPGRPR